MWEVDGCSKSILWTPIPLTEYWDIKVLMIHLVAPMYLYKGYKLRLLGIRHAEKTLHVWLTLLI